MPSPSLLLLGIVDLIAGLILVSVQPARAIELAIFTISAKIVFYVGVALVVKGVYSLFFAIR
jgi:hypothetical protein